jgi:cytochrome c peroxidase
MKKYWLCALILGFLYAFTWSAEQRATPVEIELPIRFQQYLAPLQVYSDDQLSKEQVELGRMLFYDPILSADSSQSCGSCHAASSAFTDPQKKLSTGVDGVQGTRNAMPLFNLAYMNSFFWDGRSKSLQHQALEPVVNPLEMHGNWSQIAERLNANSIYVQLFRTAFGNQKIDSMMVASAISQFELTLISGNSKFDQYLNAQADLTEAEKRGAFIFMSESKGKCFHCHGGPANPLFTDNQFHNNGLDSVFTDRGLAKITGLPSDLGRFKTPSLRNIGFTAPYMHDGRFTTLDEVINHYSEGVRSTATIDSFIAGNQQGGIHFTTEEKQDLKAFLLTLNDSAFVQNPAFSNPFPNP